MKNFKRLINLIISVCLLLSSVSIGYAANDYTGHWAQKAIDSLLANGVISGDSNGNIKPDDLILRSEFVKIVNKTFKFKDLADSNFADVNQNAWYVNEFLIAKKANYITGDQNGNANPEMPISRAEVCVILSRVLGLDTSNTDNSFADNNSIPDWARGGIVALNKKGYIKGYEDGSFNASKNTSRAEAFYILSLVEIPAPEVKPEENKTQDLGNISSIGAVVTIPSNSNSGGGGGGGGGNSSPKVAATPLVTKFEDTTVQFRSSNNAKSYTIYIKNDKYEVPPLVVQDNGSSNYKIDLDEKINEFCALTTESEISFNITMNANGKSGYKDSSIAKVATLKKVFSSLETPVINYYIDTVNNVKNIVIEWNKIEHALSYDISLIVDGVEKNSEITVNNQERKAVITDVSLVANKTTNIYVTAKSSDLSVYRNSSKADKKIIMGEHFLGDGSTENPFVITSTEDFSKITDFAANYEIISDIEVSKPIDTFTGTFTGKLGRVEGEMPTITFNFNETNTLSVALIREMNGGALKNLKTAGSVTSSGTGCSYAAGFVGINRSGNLTIENCINTVNINKPGSYSTEPYSGVGGIVGRAGAGTTITNCKNYGLISAAGNGYAGGMIGYNGGLITNCKNYAAISGGSNIGGIVGANYKNVSTSANFAPISTTGANAGGIAGTLAGSSTVIEECYNTASVSADDNSGGIVGRLYASSGATAYVRNSFNIGIVTSVKVNKGGICGYLNRGTLNLSLSYDAQGGTTMNIIGGQAASGASKTVANTYYLYDGTTENSTFFGEDLKQDELINLLNTDNLFLNTIWQNGEGEYLYPQLKNNPYIAIDK